MGRSDPDECGVLAARQPGAIWRPLLGACRAAVRLRTPIQAGSRLASSERQKMSKFSCGPHPGVTPAGKVTLCPIRTVWVDGAATTAAAPHRQAVCSRHSVVARQKGSAP